MHRVQSLDPASLSPVPGGFARPVLVSFDLCPYVQRAAIALREKQVPFERVTIDLANKPAWFLELSPTGKVPLLKVGEHVLFESLPIVEYLDETVGPRLHPADPLTRARHRAWMEFGSSVLADLWTLETTADDGAFQAALSAIDGKFRRTESALGEGEFFTGSSFSLVDAVFAPVFRYFEAFERKADLGLFADKPRLAAWRRALAGRPSVRDAVVPDYHERLLAFVAGQGGVLARRLGLA